MQVFSIGIEDSSIDLPDIIRKRAASYNSEELRLELEEKEVGGLKFCQCRCILLKDSKMSSTEFEKKTIEYLANILSDTIIEDIQIKIVEKIIQDEYFYFGKEEKDRVLFDALKIIWENQDKGGEYFALQDWRSKVNKRVAEHLSHNNEIVLDGFIRFRLKDLIKEIEDGIDRAVDDLLIEKEYNEFIKLLRYFVEIQEPKVDEVHVQVDDNKKYTLMDSSYRIINNDLLEDLAREISDKDISYDDLLISSLITIAPNKITIHNGENIKNTELMNTINSVFYGKVTLSQDTIRPN